MWWIDVIVIAIIVVCAVVGLSKGLFESILSLLSTAIAVGLAVWLARPACTIINKILPFDKWFAKMLQGQNDPLIIFGHSLSLDKVAAFLSLVAAGIIVFLLVKLVIWLLARLFDSATKNSTALSGLNRVFGLVFGALKGSIIVFAGLAVISLISQVPVMDKVGAAIEKTTVTNWMYKYVDEFCDKNLTKANLEELLDKIVGEDKPADSASASDSGTSTPTTPDSGSGGETPTPTPTPEPTPTTVTSAYSNLVLSL